MFFGDMGGNFYALDAANGQKLWGRKIGGGDWRAASSPTRWMERRKLPSLTGLHDDRVADRNPTAKVVNPGPRRRRRRTK